MDLFATHCGMNQDSTTTNNSTSLLFERFLKLVYDEFCVSSNLLFLRNASKCISKWIESKWIGQDQFHALYSSLSLYLKLSTIPIHESLDLFLAPSLDLLGSGVNSPAAQQAIQSLFDSLYSRGNEEFQTNALFVLQVFFERLTGFVDVTPAMTLIRSNLMSESASIRKFGLSLLHSVLRFSFSHVSLFPCFHDREEKEWKEWRERTESRWELFLSIYETIDEFATHLLKDVWGQIWSIQCDETPFEELKPLQIDAKWIEVLFDRALRHANPQIRLFVVVSFLSHPNRFDVSFFLRRVLPLLNDNLYYKGPLYGVGFQLLHFIQQTARLCAEANTLSSFCRDLIHSIGLHISNPSAYQFLLAFFDPSLCPSPPHALQDDVNTASSTAESLTPELIDSVCSFSIQWKLPLDETLCEDLTLLLDRISTQISFVVLLDKIRKGLLRILLEHTLFAEEQLIPAVIRIFVRVPSRVIDKAKIVEYFATEKEKLWSVTRRMFCDFVECHENESKENVACLSWLLWLAVQLGSFQIEELRPTCEFESILHVCCRSLQFRSIIGCDDISWVKQLIPAEWLESFISNQMNEWCASDRMLDAIEIESITTNGAFLQERIAEIHVSEITEEQLVVWSRWLSRIHVSIGMNVNEWLLVLNRLANASSLSSIARHVALKSCWLALSRQNCFELELFSPLLEFLSVCDDELLGPLLHFLHCFLSHIQREQSSLNTEGLADSLISTISTVFRNLRGDPAIRIVLASLLTHDFLFVESPPRGYHTLVQTILKNMGNGGASLGSTFVPLFLEKMGKYVQHLGEFVEEFELLLLMKEPREELAITKTPPTLQPRALSLQFIESLITAGNASTLLDRLLPRLLEYAENLSNSGSHVQNSEENGNRVRCWQALCVCSRGLTKELAASCFPRFLRCIQQLNLRDVRHYEELFGMQLLKSERFLESSYDALLSLLRIPSQSGQAVPSLLQIAVFPLFSVSTDSPIIGAFLEAAFPWSMAPEGLTRTVSQVLCFHVLERFRMPQYDWLKRMLAGNPRIAAMRRKQAALCEERNVDLECSTVSLFSLPLNNLNDFIPAVLMDQVREEMENLLASWYREDFPPTNVESGETTLKCGVNAEFQNSEQISNFQNSEQISNFQKKILPWELSSKSEVEHRKKQKIVVIASLVDKLPNLGGLTRTGEIFAVEKIVVNSLRCRKEQVFKSVGETGKQEV